MRRVIFVLGLVLIAIMLFVGSRRGAARSSRVEARDKERSLPSRAVELPDQMMGLEQEPASTDVRADEPRGNLTLRGRVLDSSTRPAENAIVTIDTAPRRTTTTSPDGTFAIAGLLPRAYVVGARRGSFVSVARELQLAADSQPVTLILGEAPNLDAVVVDAGDRHPIAGARLEVEEESVVATTDKDGRATLVSLTPGRYVVSASGERYAKSRVVVVHRGGPGASPVLILLTQGASVHGRVVDAAGEPVSGASVRALRASTLAADDRAAGAEVTTDSTGFWMIPALPAGAFRFSAAHPLFAPALSPPAAIDGVEPAGPIILTMEKGARISGRVMTRSGAPAPYAAIEARGVGMGIRAPLRKSVFADGAGQFVMTGLPPEDFKVEARADNGSAPPETVHLGAGDAEVTLTLSAEGLIAGSVVSARGQAVAGAQVVAVPEDRALLVSFADSKAGRYASAVTDDHGDFRLRGLSAGKYRVRASTARSIQTADFWLQTGALAEAGDEDVRIVLEQGAKLKGKVELARGAVADPFTVATTLSTPSSFAGTRGNFTIDDVTPGRHIVTITAPKAAPRVIEDVEIRAGQETDLGRIVLDSGVTLRGTVVDKQGAPVPDATVMAGTSLLGDGRKAGTATLQATTDRSGQFTLEGAVAGPLTILAEQAAGGRSAPVSIVIGAEQPPPLELRLAPTAALQGYVTVRGRPVDRAGVAAAPDGSTTGRFAVTTQADGFYQFERLSEGEYIATAVLRINPTTQILQSVAAKVGAEGSRADIDVSAGGPTVAFDVHDAAGRPIANARVYLATGNVRAATLGQLDAALAARGAGQTRILSIMQGNAVSTSEVPPGPYSVCVAPIFSDLNDGIAVQRIRDHAAEIPVSCVPAVIGPEPALQRIEFPVEGKGVR